jgi:hypothetical protein
MLRGDDHVNRRQNEQGEERADGHPADQHDAYAVAGLGAGARHKDERKVAEHGGGRRHQDRPQARHRRLFDRNRFEMPGKLELIGESNDQDTVLGDETDQGDEPDLTVDVDGCEPEEREDECRGKGERHGPGKHDQGVAEAAELRREHQIDEQNGEAERAGKRGSLLP